VTKVAPRLCLLLIAAWLAAPALRAAPTPTLYELVEQGRQAFLTENFADSLSLIQQALERPDFAHADPKLQYSALQLASGSAWATEDYLTAHEFLVAAASLPQADGDLWWRRALLASAVDNWADAALSLTALAEKWPTTFTGSTLEGDVVLGTVRELRKQPTLRQQRVDLLNALFDAGFKFTLGSEPNLLWLLLATDSLASQDLKRAREVARRITDASVLIAMRIDKRFEPLTSAEPKLFDIRAVSEQSVRRLRNTVEEHPRSLAAVMQYGYALYESGRFKELLSLSEATIARVQKSPEGAPPYDDLDDNLAWIHNHKASALRALGRWDEAAGTLKNWQNSASNRGDKASQAINLGFFFNEMGRPEDALEAIKDVDWARAMSDYGRAQYQFVRFQAYQQLGRHEDAGETLRWLREHTDDAPGTAQDALLEAGDLDAAAAMLIASLRDADQRIVALAQIQHYARTPRTDRQKKLDAMRESLLARPDVVAAVDAVGRRDRFPIHSMEY
jgi:tetratricopeptide (TPR) repeat protein